MVHAERQTRDIYAVAFEGLGLQVAGMGLQRMGGIFLGRVFVHQPPWHCSWIHYRSTNAAGCLKSMGIQELLQSVMLMITAIWFSAFDCRLSYIGI